jgi:hypothetical protein
LVNKFHLCQIIVTPSFLGGALSPKLLEH